MLEKDLEYHKEYREKNRVKINEYQREWRKANPDKMRAIRKRYTKKNPTYFIKKNIARRLKYPHQDSDRHKKHRVFVLNAYGNMCTCCKETKYEFLAIDHIGGRSRGHIIDSLKGTRLYSWLYKNNCPQDIHIRILCHNCNCAIGFYGYCPHAKETC